MVLSMSAGMLLLAALCLPGAVLAFLRLDGRPLPSLPTRSPRWLTLAALAVLFGLVLLLGSLVSGTRAGAYILPPLMIIGASVPLLLYLVIGTLGLQRPSPLRLWGSVSVSLMGSMPLAFAIEMFFMLLGLVLVGISLSLQPEVLQTLQNAFNSLSPLEDPTLLLENYASDLIRQPGVIPGILLFISLLTPLIEELVKPLAVWLLALRRPTPQQGLYLGMLSGACFALVENVNALSLPQAGGDWWITAVARGGTGLLHIVTTGLMGWAIARRKAGPLLGTYALVVLLHGVWNLFGTLQGLAAVVDFQPWVGLASAAVPVLGVLYALLFGLLLLANRRARRVEATPEG